MPSEAVPKEDESGIVPRIIDGNNVDNILSDPVSLRMICIFLLHPNLSDPDEYQHLHRCMRIFRVITRSRKAQDILVFWLCNEVEP